MFPELPHQGLKRVIALKVHNNRNLREFPSPENFPNIRTLVLSYAYHCCSFLRSANHRNVSCTYWHRDQHLALSWSMYSSVLLHICFCSNLIMVYTSTLHHLYLHMSYSYHRLVQYYHVMLDYFIMKCWTTSDNFILFIQPKGEWGNNKDRWGGCVWCGGAAGPGPHHLECVQHLAWCRWVGL